MKVRGVEYPDTTPDKILAWWLGISQEMAEAKSRVEVLRFMNGYDPVALREGMMLMIKIAGDMEYFPRGWFREEDLAKLKTHEDHLAQIRSESVEDVSREDNEDRQYVFLAGRKQLEEKFQALDQQFNDLAKIVSGADWFSKLHARRRASDYPRGDEAKTELEGTEWDTV